MIQPRRAVDIPILSDGPRLQLQSAKKLLAYNKSTTERTILNEISHLLQLLEITDEIESETTVLAGRMDIFCYRLRTIIETKKVGKASTEVLNQLEAYIHAKILEDSNELPFEISEEQNRHWTGIITDGQIWHVWKYSNTPNANAQEYVREEPGTPEELLEFLSEKIFSEKPLGKPRIPQNPYDLFVDDHLKLTKIYDGLKGRSLKETDTKLDLWRDMLRASGMEPESKSGARKLFVKHSFLVSTARNVAHILTSSDPEKHFREVLADGFVSWIVQDPDGEDWQKAFLRKINEYDWRRQKGDVLRSVYEGFISAKDRKIFGEHYTPDWLAQLLVNETLDPEWLEASVKSANSQLPLKGVGVLDPTCGSGTFLYHAARKILESDAMKSLHLPPSRQAEIAVKLVNGIDIHPIAAEISRATLLRALPAPPPDGAKSVNVWQGDSLMAFQEKEEDDRTLLNVMRYEIREKNLCFQIPGTRSREIIIPLSFCESSNFNFDMDRLISFAKKNDVPTDILRKIPEEDRPALEKCYKDFVEIIADRGNSVWAWYVTNITAPLFLSKRKINRIVANPPWVPMNDIQVEYRKKELESIFKSEKLWVGGRQAANNDIAQLFVKTCRYTYLQEPTRNQASWIVKKSMLKAGQWKKFREWYEIETKTQIIDLEELEPFGVKGSKSPIAMFDRHSCTNITDLKKFQNEPLITTRLLNAKKKPSNYMNLEEAIKLFRFSISSSEISEMESFYKPSKWKWGVSIPPDVLIVLNTIEADPRDHANLQVTTKKSSKDIWQTINPQEGIIPKAWSNKICRPKNFYPFIISSRTTDIIMPMDQNRKICNSPEKTCAFWRKLESIYQKHKGPNQPEKLIQRLDYNGELTNQIEASCNPGKCVVIYPQSGAIMRATRMESKEHILEKSIYRSQFSTPKEAAYLVSLLNSPCLTEAFAESRQSDRHFHTQIWKCLPIPQFDRQNSDHNRLVELCEEAETAVQKWYDSDPGHTEYSQQTASKKIRVLLKGNGIFDQIDEIARRMLPDQATSQEEGTSYNP